MARISYESDLLKFYHLAIAIPVSNKWNVDCIPLIKIKHNLCFGIFKSNILKFIRHTPRRFFNCYATKELD